MANHLKPEKKALVVSLLAEGNSIRGVERITGIHRDTIMRLGRRVGIACTKMLSDKMKGVKSKAIQVDELWGFIGKKEVNRKESDPQEFGEMWTFLAIDPDTKLIPSFVIGKRTRYNTKVFMDDLASRLADKVQISSDGMDAYAEAVDEAFGANVDYGQVVKTYSLFIPEERRRYSPVKAKGIYKKAVLGKPRKPSISTSIIERANLTMRHLCKRLARLTLAFSKKKENFEAAVGLVIAYYNMVKFHSSIRMTPAMAAGITDHPWTIMDLVNL